MARRLMRWVGLMAGAPWLFPVVPAQSTLGMLQGSAEDEHGQAASVQLQVEGPLGSVFALHADARGHYLIALPYGAYTARASSLGATCRIRIRPFEIARCDLRAGEDRIVDSHQIPAPGAESAAQRHLFQTPAAVSYPLDFANLNGIRLPLVSFWSASWTATGFRLNGLDATDSYQPGRPVMLDDAAAEDWVLGREASAVSAPPSDAYNVSVFLRGAERSWHGGLATENTGAAFAGSNLLSPQDRGNIERPDEFLRFTRDTADLGGPLSRWADILATATGQWASQTAPRRPAGTPTNSRILFGNTRGRVRLGARDQLDALYSGSRLDLSNGGWPSGMEAILASRMMPSFYGVDGFENLRETDHFDFVQAGWTHPFGGSAGVLEFRYGYSTAHLDTSPVNGQNQPGRIDLLDLAPADSPLSNFAVRTRHQIDGAFQSGEMRLGGLTHRYSIGAAGETSQPRNRFQASGGVDLILAAGQPAFVARLSTPGGTRVRIDWFTLYLADSIQYFHGVTLDLGLGLDVSRGAVVGQAASAGAISWTNAAPRVGIARPVPGFSRMTLRGSYSRIYSILAGRYLDFADPGALNGQVSDPQKGQLLQRFGGAYSGIEPGLKRPYADAFDVSLQLALPRQSALSIELRRQDEKKRIAAVNTGVIAAAYHPEVITDPGPDFIPGTFDDQSLVVYAQDPATLGHDQYLLTNPPGLRELGEIITATAGTHQRYAEFRASFTAGKSFGPTNPENSAWVNDPGVAGALYSDPNSLIHATGHPFVDRAFIGKIQAVFLAPGWLGGVRFTNTANYLDGLPFARELLVTGLPQGPFLVDTTLRGSPEGGNRAQYVLNWNLRVGREIHLSFGRVEIAADLLNVLNNGNKIVESDLSGPQFNQRPALALPPPRTIRLGLRWHF